MIRLLPLLLLLACAAPAALGVQVPEGEKIPAFTRRDGAGMGPARPGKLTDTPAFSRRYDDTLTLGYDALGRLESIAGMGLTETRSDLDPARPHKLTGIASFAYAYAPENVVIGDPQNRLAQVDEADGRHVYTLAADGAREAEAVYASDALQSRKVFDYNAFRQLRSIQELAPTGVETAWTDLKTDGFGRVTAYQSNAAHQPAPVERTLTWDAAGRLLSLSQSGATSTYAYNWRDQRIARTAPTLVAHYAWEDDGLLQEVKRLNDGPATTHPHLRGAGMTLAVGATRLGHDHLGSPVLSVAAGIATPKTFDAWGRLTSAPPEISEISIGYTGHAYDAESGLTYAQARYYDPTLGLFLGPDPWEGDLSRPLSLGRFGYVEGNPATRIDPDGRRPPPYEGVTEQEAESYRAAGLATGTMATRAHAAAVNQVVEAMEAAPEVWASPSVQGSLQIIGGGIECASVPGVVATPGGYWAGMAHCADLLTAGMTTITTGEATPTVTARVTYDATMWATGSDTAARCVSTLADFALSLMGMVAQSRAIVGASPVIAPSVKKPPDPPPVRPPASAKAAEVGVPGAGAVAEAAETAPALELGGNTAIAESTATAASTPQQIAVGPYSEMKARVDIPGQAHHLNQDASFKSVIATKDGMAIKLEGNAFTQPGTSHYEAHFSLEEFWRQFRRGGSRMGELPTNIEYSKGLLDSLHAAGLSKEEAMQAVRAAARQRVQHGLLGGMPVPRIPGQINQVRR